jgi:hypothetical protein
VVLEWVDFSHVLSVLIPKLPNAKGQAHQSHWGFFFWVATFVTVLRTIASTKPGGAKEKGTGMGVWRNAPGANP